MSTGNVLNIKATWDYEAKVWVAESDDVPGLITEADTISALVQKLKYLIPELLNANGYTDDDEIEISWYLFDEIYKAKHPEKISIWFRPKP